MDFNTWFSSLHPERQAILRDDKWMLARAAFEAAPWIDVNLDLPAHTGPGWSEVVLVEFDSGVMSVDAHFCADVAAPEAGWFAGEKVPGCTSKVIAWMPLPPSFKGRAIETASTDFDWSGLTDAQKTFLHSLPSHSSVQTNVGKQIANYLRRGVECGIGPQTEVEDAPPFALYVKENPGFWVDCFETVELAREAVTRLGLVLVSTQ
jgi:hypothetical protein